MESKWGCDLPVPNARKSTELQFHPCIFHFNASCVCLPLHNAVNESREVF
jgi:hypothetical protein